MPILESDGRIYRAFEDCSPKDWAGIHADSSIRRKQAFVISAPADSDLLDPANWCMSNKLPYDAAYSSSWEDPPVKPGWLEGNVVETTTGALWNIIRVNTAPVVDKAAIIHIHDEGRRVSFDPASDFIDLPGGMTKFTIRLDSETGLYCMLCNNNTDPRYPNQRNVLSLFTSEERAGIHTGLFDTACWNRTHPAARWSMLGVRTILDCRSIRLRMHGNWSQMQTITLGLLFMFRNLWSFGLARIHPPQKYFKHKRMIMRRKLIPMDPRSRRRLPPTAAKNPATSKQRFSWNLVKSSLSGLVFCPPLERPNGRGH